MPLTKKRYSSNPCDDESFEPIEKTSDNRLIIRDAPIGIFSNKLILTAEIDLSAGTIKKTWRAFVLKWHKAYTLDDYSTAEIQDKSRLIEGYPLHFFSVFLSGRGHRLKIYSTDEPEDAKAVKNALSAFLFRSRVST